MSGLFDNLDQRRAIIDRRAMAGRLDEIAAESEEKAKVVKVFKQYNEVLKKAGGIYSAI